MKLPYVERQVHWHLLRSGDFAVGPMNGTLINGNEQDCCGVRGEKIMEGEVQQEDLPTQREIPHQPLHVTLKTKGHNCVQENKFLKGPNHLPSDCEVPSVTCIPCETLETNRTKDYNQIQGEGHGEVQGRQSHLQKGAEILKCPLHKTLNVRTKATNLQVQSTGIAGDVTLPPSFTSSNSRTPNLDEIVNRLRTVNRSKELSSGKVDSEPNKLSQPLDSAAKNVEAGESIIDAKGKEVLSGWSGNHFADIDSPVGQAPVGHQSKWKSVQATDSSKASRSRKRKHCTQEKPVSKVGERSVENDLAEKRCLVVENLVVGEAFVDSASGNQVLKRSEPHGQQCAVCKEHVPQASLNNHRCKVGVSNKKLPVLDGDALDKSQSQESDRCRTCQRPLAGDEIASDKKQLSCKECSRATDQRNSVSAAGNIVVGIHKCDRCEQSFSSRSNLSLHLLSHVEVKVNKCDECDKTFRTEAMLATHKRIHAGQHPYQCHICDKTFGKSNTLTCHLRTHSGEKPYQCDLCDKSFRQNSALTVHKRIHSGEQPFGCDICGKNFRDKSNLRRHVRMHSGLQPFECSVCEKRFRTKDHLNTHFRIHSGDKPYQCSVCGKAFTQNSTLAGHMRTHQVQVPS